MINRIVLIGRLTADPELRQTPNGVSVTTFTLAVDRSFTKQNGEKETDFIRIVTWRGLAENCANYLKKGRLAAVDGRLQIRSYENKEGRRMTIAEVVADNVRFLESKGKTSDGKKKPSSSNIYGADDPFEGDGETIDISDESLPF